MKKVFVTGAAGFIGFHLSKALLSRGIEVVGLDSMNDYYDVTLKENRLSILKENEGFRFVHGELEDRQLVRDLMRDEHFDAAVNLAAQAGVRYSLTHPEAYISSNQVGFFNLIDAAKEFALPHFLYASSSSIYGANTKMPFSEDDQVDTPVSLYAATKKGNELLAHAYSHMFGVRTTGLRFFTVYGPYGRPDMALFKFTKSILAGEPIELYNGGDMQRDFTYVDDTVEGIVQLLARSASIAAQGTPYNVYNISNSHPVSLSDFVAAIEMELCKKAIVKNMPMQAGDVKATCADISKIQRDTGYQPTIDVQEGIRRFVQWYKKYYGIS